MIDVRNGLDPARTGALALHALALLLGCRAPGPSAAPAQQSPESCASAQQELVAFVQKLPEHAVVGDILVDLPESTLGRGPGSGPVLQIAEGLTYVDGAAIAARSPDERRRRVSEWVQGWHASQPRAGEATLYVAASSATDVQTLRAHLSAVPSSVEVRLLVRTRGLPSSEAAPAASGDTHEIGAALLAEREPSRREAIAARGYTEFSSCSELTSAVSSIRGSAGTKRWPALRAALVDALPRCKCEDLNAPALQQLIAAEQRAGAAALGWLPLSFLRDERCGASMPLRAAGKLVRQMESFDAEFAGGWQNDALRFEEVVADERLLGYFCNALPGETLGARQRARAELYWRAAASSACEPWRFEPLAPGAPMGTWRRVTGPEPLAFHYRQAAEEIRLFGPVPAGSSSKPTEERDWACQQNYRLLGVDAESIRTDAGTWFFNEEACRRAPPAAAHASGCVAALAFPGAVEPAPAKP